MTQKSIKYAHLKKKFNSTPCFVKMGSGNFIRKMNDSSYSYANRDGNAAKNIAQYKAMVFQAHQANLLSDRILKKINISNSQKKLYNKISGLIERSQDAIRYIITKTGSSYNYATMKLLSEKERENIVEQIFNGLVNCIPKPTIENYKTRVTDSVNDETNDVSDWLSFIKKVILSDKGGNPTSIETIKALFTAESEFDLWKPYFERFASDLGEYPTYFKSSKNVKPGKAANDRLNALASLSKKIYSIEGWPPPPD